MSDLHDVLDGEQEVKPAEETPAVENNKEEIEAEPTIAKKTEDKGNVLNMQTDRGLK